MRLHDSLVITKNLSRKQQNHPCFVLATSRTYHWTSRMRNYLIAWYHKILSLRSDGFNALTKALTLPYLASKSNLLTTHYSLKYPSLVYILKFLHRLENLVSAQNSFVLDIDPHPVGTHFAIISAPIIIFPRIVQFEQIKHLLPRKHHRNATTTATIMLKEPSVPDLLKIEKYPKNNGFWQRVIQSCKWYSPQKSLDFRLFIRWIYRYKENDPSDALTYIINTFRL